MYYMYYMYFIIIIYIYICTICTIYHDFSYMEDESTKDYSSCCCAAITPSVAANGDQRALVGSAYGPNAAGNGGGAKVYSY